MRIISVVIAGFVLTVLLTSCSVKTGTEAGTTTSAPADTPTATEAATPAATESGIKVVSLVSGDKFDEESKEITSETTTFSVDTPEIFVNAGITGLPTGAKITGTFTAVDVTLADGTALKDKELKSVDVTAPGSEATARFSFTPPEQGWPVGSYVVKVSVDGQEVDSVELTVEKSG